LRREVEKIAHPETFHHDYHHWETPQMSNLLPRLLLMLTMLITLMFALLPASAQNELCKE